MAEDNDLSVMPFYDISTYELISDLFFKSETVRNDIYQNTTFYNSIISSSNNEILRQLNFSYCTDREFNNLVHDVNGKIELSLFHTNIRSLNKNHRGLSYFMQLIDLDFDVIVLSEIWNYNLEFYSNIFKNYNFHYVVPDGSNIGGVGIFVIHEFSCNVLDDYKFTSSNKVESLWLEISKNNRKYIVAGIYRHPDRDIEDFSVQIDKLLENISKKKTPCVIAGDINIDFVKYGAHRETTDYVNNLLVNNFIPP